MTAVSTTMKTFEQNKEQRWKHRRAVVLCVVLWKPFHQRWDKTNEDVGATASLIPLFVIPEHYLSNPTE